MGKGWGPSTAGAGYTGRSCRSTAHVPYSWLPAGQPNATCRAPSFACELRWTLEMMATIEVAVVCLRSTATIGLAPTAVPALACSTSQ